MCSSITSEINSKIIFLLDNLCLKNDSKSSALIISKQNMMHIAMLFSTIPRNTKIYALQPIFSLSLSILESNFLFFTLINKTTISSFFVSFVYYSII
jgi:hypothetical protein